MFNKNTWIEIDCEGEASKQRYFGRFEVKPFLVHKERADAARLAEVYCRGIREDVSERAFLTSLAFVKMHIVSSDASWWKEDGLDLVDEAPIYEIIKKINELQNPSKTSEKTSNESQQQSQ